MNDNGLFLFVLLMLLLGVGILILRYRRSDSLLQTWAARNGYRIVQAEYRNFVRGPFFLTTARGQTVYRVVVADQQGYTRSGWVRCGSWWLGLFSDQVEVRWDD